MTQDTDTIVPVAPIEVVQRESAPTTRRETVFDVQNLSVFYGSNPTPDRSQKRVTHNVVPTPDRERHAMSDEIRVRVQRNVRRRIVAIRVPVEFDHRVSIYSGPRVQVREGQTLHRTRRPSKKLEI